MSNVITLPSAGKRNVPTSYKALRSMLDREGFVLRRKGGGYLITDLDGIPVHETYLTPYACTLDDVQWWAEQLCN